MKSPAWYLALLGLVAGCNTLLDIESAPKRRSQQSAGSSGTLMPSAGGSSGGITNEGGGTSHPTGEPQNTSGGEAGAGTGSSGEP